MTHVLDRDQIRAYDRHAIERCSVPGLVLMENAGRGAADRLCALASAPRGHAERPVVIVCGRGNNGGDGFVVARHLATRGLPVRVVLLGTVADVTGDARANLDAYLGLGRSITQVVGDDDLAGLGALLDGASQVVDAIFGTGLDRPVTGSLARVVELVNQARAPIVALDIPSGIDANTGQVLGSAVRAQHTLTFARPKVGLFAGAGAEHAGAIEVVDLGIPDEAIIDAVGFRARVVSPSDVARWLGRRAADAHKYRSGSLLVVAGSPGKIGAALLAARGALRAGAGIVTVGTWPEAAEAIDRQAGEWMTTRLDPTHLDESLAEALARRDAVAIGPGLGLGEQARRLVERIVIGFAGPVVVDADAVSAFAGRAEELRLAAGPRVLTPHAGELGRLLGARAADVEADRFGWARRGAEQTGQLVVLKGRNTVIARPDGGLWVCTAGNVVLATGGSGDVLTGIMGALACNAPAEGAACAAVYLHATAADDWRAASGADRGMVAGDLAAALPAVIARVLGPA